MQGIPVALLLVSAMLFVPSAGAQSTGSAWTRDGLEPITVKGVDAAFARPGASLAQYDQVLLRPVEVAFHKDWARNMSTGSRFRVSPTDMQRIRTRLAARLQDAVKTGVGGRRIPARRCAGRERARRADGHRQPRTCPAPAINSGMHQPDVYAGLRRAGDPGRPVARFGDRRCDRACVQSYASSERDQMTRIDNFENDVEAGKACAPGPGRCASAGSLPDHQALGRCGTCVAAVFFAARPGETTFVTSRG
jgi:hypothetical protein